MAADASAQRAELEFLIALIGRERRRPRRSLQIEDFASRAALHSPDDAEYLTLLAKAAAVLEAPEASRMLHEYLQRVQPGSHKYDVDMLIVCVKPVELGAVLAALGRAADAGRVGDKQGASGREYFDGEISSRVAGRDLSYRVIAMNEQGNRSAAIETSEILSECAPRLAVLVGMAAGPSKFEPGDVVASEMVIDAGPGTRRDGKRVAEPTTLEPATTLMHQVKSNRPELNGWHERLREAADAALEAGVPLPREGREGPAFTSGVVVSDEEKDETTTLDEWLEAYSGDAKAYDMESAGFGGICARARIELGWVVFRGISDAGAEEHEGEVRRPKDLQMWATLSAATCFLTWVTCQTSLFGTDGER